MATANPLADLVKSGSMKAGARAFSVCAWAPQGHQEDAAQLLPHFLVDTAELKKKGLDQGLASIAIADLKASGDIVYGEETLPHSPLSACSCDESSGMRAARRTTSCETVGMHG
jgi:hypothetical protein